MNNFLTFISKHENKIKFLLILYALYCSIIIGVSWDEKYYHILGKINLNYLLSFGLLEENFYGKYRYSTIYWSFSSLISQLAPSKYSVEIHHVINTSFGLLTIIGLYKVAKKLFNKIVAINSSIFLFLIPFFFGHLAINSKDTILAFAHVWILYYLIKYSLKNLSFKKRLTVILKISTLSAIGTGIQLLFIGSLTPLIFLFFAYFIFTKKKQFKEIAVDLVIYVILFYLILVLFWVDAHDNIFTQPYNFFLKSFSLEIGWPYNILNGVYSSSYNVAKNYLLVNYLYKLPEFLLFLYFLAIPVIIFKFNKLKKVFKNVSFKLFSIIILLIFPNLVLIFITYPIYDGLRLFLWVSPYLVIIPAITFFLIIDQKEILFSFLKIVTIFLMVFHIFNFIKFTPYHYTYLNILNGDKDTRYKNFENDYWSVSLKELIYSSNITDKKINYHSCGVNPSVVKIYMKNKYNNAEYTNFENATYILMTNRSITSSNNGITNCFDKYPSDNVHEVSRNGMILSAIKKIK